MPRNNGIYNLPSPPMPLVPDTLAMAEDLNTTLSDIALGITGSMAVDGSTAFTGPVNFNGQTVGGIGTLTVTGGITSTNVTCNGLWVNTAAYITGLSLSTQMNANGQNIIGVGTINATGANITNLNVTSEAVAGSLTVPYLTVNTGANITGLALIGQMNANNQNILNVSSLGAASLTVSGSITTSSIHTAGSPGMAWAWDGVYLSCYMDGGFYNYYVRSSNLHEIELNTGAGQGIFYYNRSGSFVYWPIYWSDRRLKSDIEPAGDALGLLRGIDVHDVTFTKPFPDAEPEHWPFSLIADEVAAAFPVGAIAPPKPDGYASVNQLAMLALHHRALQQLDERLTALEAAR